MSKRPLTTLLQSVWFMPVVILSFLIVVTKGKLVTALLPLLRFIIPIALIWLVFRLVKWRLKKKFQESMAQFEQEMRHRTRPSAAAGGGQTVIEICPRCGAPKGRLCPMGCAAQPG